jgi:hypothetical protein
MLREVKNSFLEQEQFVSETHDEQQDFKKAGDETHAASVTGNWHGSAVLPR